MLRQRRLAGPLGECLFLNYMTIKVELELTLFHRHLIDQQEGVLKVSKPHVRRPPYPAQLLQQIGELVQSSRNVDELVMEFGCHVSSILSWVRKVRLNRPARITPNMAPSVAV